MIRAFGKFNLLRPLGRGAMGEVYLGEDPVIGRRVAIKTIRRAEAETAEARDRFLREARAAGALNHPNLVTLHEFGEVEGTLFLAMEYVEGEDLEALMRDRRLLAQDLLEVLAQVCEGLAYAHGRGVIHRDIKPSNIRVLREGERLQAKVMDFGIARLHDSELTGTGTLLGTFGYMAPEYIQSGRPEVRSDLFAVGVILYEALAGHRPFEGDTTATILYRVVHEEPPPLDFRGLPGISPLLGDVLRRALAKEPWARFPDGNAMAKALRDAKDPGWGGLAWAPAAPPPTRVSVAVPELDEPAAAETPTVAIPAPPRHEPTPQDRRPWRGAALWFLPLAAAGGGLWWFLRPKPVPVVTIPPSEVAPPVVPQPHAAPAKAPRPALKPAPKAEPHLSPEAVEALLDEAAFGLQDTPQQSLQRIDRVLKAQPDSPRARALQVTALYYAGRYEEMPKALGAARDAGMQVRRFAFFAPFQTMMRTERVERRLPEGVRTQLGELFPRMEGRPPQRFQR